MASSELKDGIPTFYAADQAAWRAWLQENHACAERVWLILYNKDSGVPSISWPEAVDEAICFGWIDSKATKRDGQSRYQFFCRRNPKSAWSKINKEKVERMMAEGKIATAGLEMIAKAKEIGSWTFLDAVEAQIVPPDLAAAFAANADAWKNFQAFPPSTRKGILHWVIQAKTPETRAKRVAETVAKASLNERANAWKPKS